MPKVLFKRRKNCGRQVNATRTKKLDDLAVTVGADQQVGDEQPIFITLYR